LTTAEPSKDVLAAFGVHGRPSRLVGGQGETFRAADLVSKPVLDIAETEWIQALLDAVEPDGFTTAAPVAANDGRWVYAGWAANRFSWTPACGSAMRSSGRAQGAKQRLRLALTVGQSRTVSPGLKPSSSCRAKPPMS
jgi:hypothetical protein